MISLPARAVIKRELLTGLRNPKPFLFMGFLVVVMIVGLVFLVKVLYEHEFGRNNMVRGGSVRELFMTLSMALYLGALLLIPPLAGASICIEKQQDSYDLLRMTYIRPLSLAIAKLCNVLGLYFLIVIGTLPFVGVFFFLVGIDSTQFVVSFTLIILSALSLAVVGLLCSAWCYRTLPAIISAYILGALAHGAGLVGLMFLLDTTGRNTWLYRTMSQMDEELISALIPFFGLVFSSQGRGSLEILPYAALYHGIIVIGGLLLTLRILRRPTSELKVDTEVPIDDQVELKARRKNFPYYLLDPRRRRPLIPDHQNPVLAKELQTGLLYRGAFAIRILYGFTLLSFFIALFSAHAFIYSETPEIALGYAFFYETIFILVITPTLVATTMAKEWEWQNVDSLKITLLTPEAILLGKFRAALTLSMIPVLGALLGSSLLIFFAYDSLDFWRISAMGLGSMVVCVIYALSISLWSASGQRKSVPALLMAYGTGIVAIALTPIIAVMIFAATLDNLGPDNTLIAWSFFLSPIYAWIFGLEEIDYWSHFSPTAYWFLNCCAFLGISAILLALTKYRFIRSFRREQP